MKNKVLLTVSFIALFAAIICIGCFLRIPLGPVPIVLQNALAVLTGVLLGSYLGGAPSALWLVVGLIGLPVYSGGTSGVGVWQVLLVDFCQVIFLEQLLRDLLLDAHRSNRKDLGLLL